MFAETSGGSASAMSSRPLSVEDDMPLSQKASPIPESMSGPDRRRSAFLDETPPPEPVVIQPVAMEADPMETPKRKPPGGVAMISVQAIQEALSASRSTGNLVQRSKSMKTESADAFRAENVQNRLRVSSSGVGGECHAVDPEKTPLSAQNSPVKRGLNVSSDFFQRSRSFSAKVSETHQALGEFPSPH